MHRLITGVTLRSLLAPTGDQQQRVVDGDAQADQGHEELDDEAHVGDAGQCPHYKERGQDRRRRDQQRDQGQQGSEHERQHHQRTDGANHGLGEHSPAGTGVVHGGQLGDAGDMNGRFGRQCG
jgi:hypothetical protein